ncbi:DUF29 domain-containing protein [Geminocystis sp. CENA526]|uniref:DUF29 domain-containing protein n=1 Tax=Geminocystis sp. CENA526 TaxID=1355871 RepID=UPI003D6F2974
MRVIDCLDLKNLYEVDGALWLEKTVELLQEKKFNELDLDNLIAEIIAMGISQKKELKNRLRVLIMHLLKYKYQTDKRSKSWLQIIIEQRRQLEDLLTYNPSLKSHLLEVMDKCYQDARKDGSKETSLPLQTFPLTSPFSIEQILDHDFFPQN